VAFVCAIVAGTTEQVDRRVAATRSPSGGATATTWLIARAGARVNNRIVAVRRHAVAR
jgi:hypothetical protein